MKWLPVQNKCRTQPRRGSYSDWKERVACDCGGQCVYCAIPESRYGGLDNFHIDHFRPKSRFRRLVDRISNLYLACAICNRFKSDDWPCEPKEDHSAASYPDPGSYNYNELFDVDHQTLCVAGKYVASRYLAERLYLNRPQLVRERRAFALESRIRELRIYLAGAIDALASMPAEKETQELLAAIAQSLLSISDTTEKLRSSPPYTLADIRRRKRPGKGVAG